jgi:hypothetical protein
MIRKIDQQFSTARGMMSIASALALLGGALVPHTAMAAGPSGTVSVTGVRVDGDDIYVSVSGSANPDSCGAATVVKLTASNATTIDRMYSLAVTAMVTGRNADIWYSVSTPWGFTVPQAYSVYVMNS